MNTKLLIGIGLAVILAGCASAPRPNAALESARAVVQSVEADPNVTKYAPLDLESAKKELQIAESAAIRHDDAAIAQPAYLAAQTARLAQLKASAKADDARVAVIEEYAALMTGQDGKSRKIWVEAAHNGARVPITRWLAI
jgi:Domain of unknown function (DUF4398)